MKMLSRLWLLGSQYFWVVNRAKPSLKEKILRGSQDVTRMYSRTSNLNPSIRKGWRKRENNAGGRKKRERKYKEEEEES